MSAPKTPRVWLEYRHEDTAGSTTVYRWSRDDLGHPSTYEGGWKEGRAVSFGTVVRPVSDFSGEPELSTATVTLDDTDSLLRTLLDTDSTAYVAGRDAAIKAASDTQIAAAGTATILLRGKAARLKLGTGLGASLEIEDVLGSTFGPAPFDRMIGRPWRREIFPDIHRDLVDATQWIVPIIAGEVSDSGATDSTGANAEKGLCPGFYVGKKIISSTGTVSRRTTEQTLLPPPPAPTYTKFGSGGSHTWTYACCVRTSTGRTTLGESVTITNLPADGSFTPSNGVTLFLATYSADLMDQVTGIDLYVKDGSDTSSAPWRFVDAAGQMFNTTADEYFSGGVGYDDDGDDSHHKGYNPPPSKNTATVTVTETVNGTVVTKTEWGLIVFAGHACKSLLGLYGSDGGDTGSSPERVAWTIGGMADVLDPSSPDWPHADPYIDLPGTDGVTERFYGIYVTGPRLQHHIDGRVTIAANICGMEDVGDSTGDTIDQAAYVWQHLLSEWAFANDGKGYLTGAWAGLPAFADTTKAIDSTSVTTAQSTTATFLGTAKGYLAGFCLTRPIAVREFLREFNRSFTAFTYVNAFGQLALGIVNPSADPNNGTIIREDIDDVLEVGAPDELDDQVENRVRYRFDFDTDAEAYRSDLEEVKSSESFEAYQGWRDTDTYEQRLTRDAATARDAAQRRLALLSRAPLFVPVRMGLSGWNLQPFDQVRISGIEGLGASGYSLRPALVMRRTDDPDDGSCELVCWDLGRILGLGFGEQSGNALTWGDWSTNTLTWGDWDTTSLRWGG